jgi:autotransporter-associated beta strand protein
MKKYLFSVALATIMSAFPFNAQAQTLVPVLQEEFTADVGAWGFTGGGHTYSWNASDNSFSVQWYTGGTNRGVGVKTLATAISPSTIDNQMTIESILQVPSGSTLGNNNSKGVFYFLNSEGKPLFGVGVGRHGLTSGNGLKLVRLTRYDLFTKLTSNYSGADVLDINNPTVKLTVVLDFSTQTYSYSAVAGTFDFTTRLFTAGAVSISSSDNPFLSRVVTDDAGTITETLAADENLIANFGKIETCFYRAGGSPTPFKFMYFGVSTMQNVSLAPVTVKFKDQNGNYFLPDTIVADRVVGLVYNVPPAFKKTVFQNDFYYVLNANSPTGITVAEGGSVLELLFDKWQAFDVTVRKQDQGGVFFKPDSIFRDLQASTAFSVPAALLATERIDGYDYIFDAENSVTQIDSIAGDSTLILKFNKLSVTAVTVRFKDQDGVFFKSDSIFGNLQKGTAFAVPAALLETQKIDSYFYVLNSDSPVGIESIPGDTTLILLFDKKLACTVTVKFTDQNGVEFKTAEVVADLMEGDAYLATEAQKATYTTISDYYALNPASPVNIPALAGDAVLTLLFEKTALLYGTFNWTAANGNTWNEFDKNFSVESTPTAYQAGNEVSFGETAEDTEVVLTQDIDLGAANALITSGGYNFSGAGALNGAGKFVVTLPGATDVLGFEAPNYLAEGVEYTAAGVLELKNAAAPVKIALPDASKLVWNVDANIGTADTKIPITGEGTLNLDAKYGKSYYLALNGYETLNIAIGQASDTAEVKVDCDPLSLGEIQQINISNATSTTVRYGANRAQFIGKKLHLGDRVHLSRSADSYGAEFTIGELTGAASSFIESANTALTGTTREVTYIIGGLGTDATFNGTIAPFKNQPGLNPLHLQKVGAGAWTLTAQHTFYNGDVAVNEGTLKLAGSNFHDSIAVSVAADAVLSVANNATAETKIGKSLTLAEGATLAIEINAANGNSDAITASKTIVCAGTLNVINIGGVPADEQQFNILSAADDISGEFSAINLPALPEGYSWDTDLLYSDGVLTLNVPASGIDNVLAGKTVKSVEYFDVTGRKVSEYAKGLTLVKTTYTDGSIDVKKNFIRENYNNINH